MSGMLVTSGVCRECYGSGTSINHKGESEPCPQCLATGCQFTPLGLEMLKVLRQFYNLNPNPER